MPRTETYRRDYFPTDAELTTDDALAERAELVEMARRDIRERAAALYMIAQEYGADHLISDQIIECAECLALEAGAL